MGVGGAESGRGEGSRRDNWSRYEKQWRGGAEQRSQRREDTESRNLSPATWQLMVTFAPRMVFTVLPISTVTAGNSLLTSVALDVFINGFPVSRRDCGLLNR